MIYDDLYEMWTSLKKEVETNIKKGLIDTTWHDVQSLIHTLEAMQTIKSASDSGEITLTKIQLEKLMDISQLQKIKHNSCFQEISVISNKKNNCYISIFAKDTDYIEFFGKSFNGLLDNIYKMIASQPDELTAIQAAEHVKTLRNNNQTNLDHVKDWSAFWTQTN